MVKISKHNDMKHRASSIVYIRTFSNDINYEATSPIGLYAEGGRGRGEGYHRKVQFAFFGGEGGRLGGYYRKFVAHHMTELYLHHIPQ